jgi:ferredoxin
MIKVDKNKCIGCGLCVSICPDNFVLDQDGKAGAVSQENSGCAETAASGCPVEAIELI